MNQHHLMQHLPHRINGARPLASAILLAPVIAFAQALPDAGSILEQNKARELTAPPTAGEKVLPDPAPVPAVSQESAQRVLVRRFVLKGVSAFPETVLQDVLKPFTGRELGFAELDQATAALTAYYRGRGYMLAHALLPAQELGQGVVQVHVLEGRVSSIALAPDAGVRLRASLARRYIDALVPVGQPVRGDDLERALLLLQDVPGVSTRAELSPGARVGETALALGLSEGPLVSGNFGVDNSSNRYTGRVRFSAGMNLNDVAGLGGQISLLASTTGSDFKYARAGYVMPAGAAGTRLGGSYSALRYGLGAEFASLGARGTANVAQLLAMHPLLRSRYANLNLRAGFDDKRYVNEANGVQTSDKHVRTLPLGVGYSSQDQLFGGGYNAASLDITPGRADLSGNASARAADASGARSHGDFVRANYEMARYQRVSPEMTGQISLSGQFASKNLESGEKMSLGGPDRVRAYPAGEASGDAGHVLSLEGRYSLASIRSELSVFFDYGHVTLNRRLYAGALAAGTPNSYSLKGIGLGVRWQPMAGAALQVQVASRIGSNPAPNADGNDVDGSSSRMRAWFQLSAYF